ncbi:MAG TPA: RNA polymerase sigma factor [Gaiellaceae bacterium]|nr:RNA polymerase sigma factor [Gaiellaceae bacterium]
MSANPVLERPRVAQAERSPQEHAGDLYERYYERVFGYCLYKLGNRQEAEDAAQTTFLWVLRGLEHGIEPRLEANWLFTIAQNACRARIRTRGRKREQETLSDPQILEQIAPGRAGASDELVGLTDALRDMPELQRQAIILREWRGFSYKEIAAELELTDAAVETLIFRARRSLASKLENPKARPAKHAALALNFGSLASALKSLFGLGGSAKMAALAAAVAAVGIGVGVQGDTAVHSTPVATKPSAGMRVQAAVVPVVRPGPAKEKKGGSHRNHSVTSPHGAPGADGSQEPDSTAPPAFLGSPPVEQATAALAPATDLADKTLADVNDVVVAAGDVVEPVVAEVPPLP